MQFALTEPNIIRRCFIIDKVVGMNYISSSYDEFGTEIGVDIVMQIFPQNNTRYNKHVVIFINIVIQSDVEDPFTSAYVSSLTGKKHSLLFIQIIVHIAFNQSNPATSQYTC